MFEVPVREIPRETSLMIDVELGEGDLEALFAEVKDFHPGDVEGFEARVRTQRIGDAIRVAGYVASVVRFKCGRCLEAREIDVEGDLEYMLLSRAEFESRYGTDTPNINETEDEDEGLALSAADLDVHFYEGDTIDLRPYLREVILLELPSFAICPEELAKECQRDYEANVGSDTIEENEEVASLDPRWSKLLELKKKNAESD